MKSFTTIGLMFATAIAFVLITSPEQESVTADDTMLPQSSLLRPVSTLLAPVSTAAFNDLEERVLANESNIADLQSQVAKLASQPGCPCPPQAATQQSAAPMQSTVTSSDCPSGACPPTIASSSYSARWKNNDGLSLREHAVQKHGIDPSLPTSEIYRQHDAYHDVYGGAQPGTTSRTVVRSGPFVTRSVQTTSNCPEGVCPPRGILRSNRPGYVPFQPLRNLGKFLRR